ncbi:hypothetical protein [Mangrovimonas xylaniphaga]|uniref:hypothetical protein n=1 Tax=Mangrovimonas xylaniphaga TaxID=1645915 RepID=UPI0006B68EA7|nr:hypothetical protein [Mangrovimonas xylaniphaga]
MKVKLKKFTEFSKSILPNEAKYLASLSHQIQDDEKMQILTRIIDNAVLETGFVDFDVAIDKRKYTYIKNWVDKKLEAIDVDKNIVWLLRLRQLILTDAISYEDEKEFLHFLHHYKHIDYYFQNLFELVKEYQSYLLIRMRYRDHKIVADFLQAYREHYERAIQIHEKLYNATEEITSQYTLNNKETKYWEDWLLEVFRSNTVDGKNRYQAFVLLTFMYTNYNEKLKLRSLFDEIDVFFSQGEMYSRRLLSNYYANRVLMHSKDNELQKAEYYGFLSIRQYNDDTLMYLNNLVAITLRNKKTQLAFSLLEEYKPLFDTTHNNHQKNSYVSYKVRVLTDLYKYHDAETLARLFLKHNKTEVFNHRWHHFFTSYINVLVIQEKYAEVLKLTKKFNLREREIERKRKSNYVPNISWSISLSRYMEGEINSSKLLEEIKEPIQGIEATDNQKLLMTQVIDKLSNNLPEAFLYLKSHMQL